jgi:hypothetical protein
MTLSHRWGTALFTKLLKSNLDSFCDRISVAHLPKIFQEATFASRQLGVRYLWIDSLCIMQDKDDLTDWKHEASLMSQVYSNSHCNLSASDTDKDADTLFKHRNVKEFRPIMVKLCTTGFFRSAHVGSVTCQLTQNELWESNVSRCPIQKRGWVYQERVLAPRIIHFGHGQLFWECREQRLCEQYPHALPSTISAHSGFNFKRLMDFERISLELAPQDLYPDSLSRNDAYLRIWENVVEEYSQTSLTNPTDKLIAISGIAKSFANVTSQIYVAGLWRESLEHALLWTCPESEMYDVDGAIYPQPTTWRAPSWSWASVDGPIVFSQYTRNLSLISVQDVVLTHATEDEMGLLTGGWLDLRGTLKPIRIFYSHGRRGADGLWKTRDLIWTRVYLDYRYLDPWAFGGDKTEVDLFYMPIAIPEAQESLTVYLLLLRLIDYDKLLFERVGIGHTRKLNQESLENLLKNDTSEKKKVSLPDIEYLDDGTHVVRIV